MDVLLECQEYLAGVDRLDQVVCYLRADGLVHDIFLFALSDHHHGCLRLYLFDTLQSLQTCESRHHLVEHDQVKRLCLTEFYGIGTIAGSGNLIAFLLQKDEISLEQIHLVIYP